MLLALCAEPSCRFPRLSSRFLSRFPRLLSGRSCPICHFAHQLFTAHCRSVDPSIIAAYGKEDPTQPFIGQCSARSVAVIGNSLRLCSLFFCALHRSRFCDPTAGRCFAARYWRWCFSVRTSPHPLQTRLNSPSCNLPVTMPACVSCFAFARTLVPVSA